MRLLKTVRSGEARVGIIGMGYVGLPLARVFCAKGFHVVGFDIDAGRVSMLNRGKSYIKHISPHVVANLVRSGKFSATCDFKRLKQVDAIIICVPTPLTETKDPDLSFIVNTSESIAAELRTGQLVVLESTTYPGTTLEVVRPILERKGLKAGKDFYLAFSPEREDPGNPDFSTDKIPKVVGADDETSLSLACALYGAVVTKVVPVSSTAVAEATKLLENIYRCVNIALVNELKVVFERMGVDIWEVIGAASTKPFGYQPFFPGPGLGGHCIPIDPFYLSWKARQFDITARFIELAGEINTTMPYYVVHKMLEALNARGATLKGTRVLLLGVAYKRDVDDMRESPALKLIQLLREHGARVDYSDPHIPELPPTRHYRFEMKSVPVTKAALRRYDCALIATDHTAFDYQFIVSNSKLVFDSRNAARNVTRDKDRIVKV
ncbi:MAG: nucleotide sugar dehydrogenase [Planctomycetota bacterium]|nr:nucleotide sugar dehydrogenase [Planctomycetota bacterium]